MRVSFEVIANGTDITAIIADRVTGITITDEAGSKSDTAQITLDDRDYKIALPPVGARLQIGLGLNGLITPLGTYVVDDLAGDIAPATLVISAKAADMRGAIRSQKTRAWTQTTLETIVGTIAGEHGLKPRVSKTLLNTHYSYLAQTSESDLNFLSRLAKDLDAVAKPAGDALVFLKHGEALTADGTALPVFTYARADISRGNWQQTGRGRYGRVIAEWGDVGTATPQKVTQGDAAPELVLRHRFPTQEEAERAAHAALEKSRRESGSIDIELSGFDGALMAEAPVVLEGIKPELSGRWIVKRVRHVLGTTLQTSFTAERDTEEQS